MDDKKQYYNLQEASELIKVCTQTLRRAIKENQLKAQKIGKTYVLKAEDLKKYIKARFNTDDLKTIQEMTKAL